MTDKFNYSDYQTYIVSSEWLIKKSRFIVYKLKKHQKIECEVCGMSVLLNIHHKTYKRLYKEKFNDLIILCAFCHKKLHEDHTTLEKMTKEMLKLKKYLKSQNLI